MREADNSNWPRLLQLLEPVHARAAALARRLSKSEADGDDLFQEAVLRAWEKLPALRDPARFSAWFFAILLSVHRNRARAAFWRRFLPLTAGEDGEEHDPPGEDGGRWEEERVRAQRMQDALSRLPAVQREAVVLLELEGFTVEEIAALQKVSASAVKSRLARGRARLRRHYERLGASPGAPRVGLIAEGERS